ncbi:MAG: ABC transporter ATP-binding protein [Deltaproteobacteria bacterium]|jgi:putative ABC transport system ATP-binding protein|nr:ABC transporter ATP-binding protein [Deltaproteobacteria bacterium]MDH4008576.1 ABC transporter ATP-binding protein [Desulfuromonadales bacterium]
MVEIRNLHLSLIGGAGPVNILRGVDLSVKSGETISIVGPSGAGKTTLLMALSGLERPSSGQVRIADTDLTAISEDDLARFRRSHVGIVFQSFHLVPTMTALENVSLPLEFAAAADPAGQAKAALEETGLGDRLHHFPGELSGGEQQRVALARAFVANPSLLLADEPTGNLDRETGIMVMDLLFSLQKEHGTTLVLVTHDETLASRCNRSIQMIDGRVMEATGTSGE